MSETNLNLVMGDYIVPTYDALGVSPIACIDNGRWGLDKDLNLVDRTTQTLYKRPEGVDKKDVVFVDVPDLNPGSSNPLSLVYLFTLMVKPIFANKANLVDVNNGLQVYVANGTMVFDPKQVYWQMPDGGIAFDSEFRHVPGTQDLLAASDGRVKTFNDVPVSPGYNADGSVQVKTLSGKTANVNVGRLVLLAWGKYTIENWQNTLAFLDGDNSNFDLGNMTLDRVEDVTRAIEATDVEHIRILND